ncbi:hypothetical protein DM02DRAFT_648834 [Periconia macrospinosa]|uniref:Uncharacterized protein n=1 Tax=Periconia macrospinosa TaxID=97972 RepID=A0A2V1E9Y0_9PLEO|nr:hypothetical protein DM02DRAFT_648834 [Periconia macrospinosa]
MSTTEDLLKRAHAHKACPEVVAEIQELYGLPKVACLHMAALLGELNYIIKRIDKMLRRWRRHYKLPGEVDARAQNERLEQIGNLLKTYAQIASKPNDIADFVDGVWVIYSLSAKMLILSSLLHPELVQPLYHQPENGERRRRAARKQAQK